MSVSYVDTQKDHVTLLDTVIQDYEGKLGLCDLYISSNLTEMFFVFGSTNKILAPFSIGCTYGPSIFPIYCYFKLIVLM